MKLSILAIISAVASVVSAYTPPVGEPKGNPIGRPGLNEQVPAGKPYTITWSPTTEGTVSLVLLRGPSENVVPIATIVEGIANSGTYSWTPSTALEADVARYGIQIIVDGTGQYQYSTQFGIANDAVVSTTTSTTTSSTATGTSTSTTKTTTDSTTTTPTTISTSTTATANVTTISSTTKIPATTTKLTTDVEEETGVPTPANTTTTIKPTQSPIQEESAAGKAVGSFGLVAFVAGVVALAM